MFQRGYLLQELRRRWGRTLVTALGLAVGVGLVLGIIGLSQGLSEAQTAAAILGKNYPGSGWYKDAYNIIKGRNLRPTEDKGSWISKAFRRVL